MHHSPFKLLFASGLVSVIGFVGMAKYHSSDADYVPGHTTEYHPPATQDREEAADALRASGFTRGANEAVDVFTPNFRSAEPLAIGTRLSHTVVQESETTEVHAAISVVGRDVIQETRAPLDLVVVIDRSGSMVAENKITYARAATRTLIDTLGPQDRLSIVSYSTEATVDVEPTYVTAAAKNRLYDVVDGLDCQGGTNISAGLELARQQFPTDAGEMVRRIVLLSDGQATHGEIEVGGLSRIASNTLESGASITAMGLGLDYDENVMHAISRASAGNYYFIESATQTEEVFATELTALQATLARNTVLDVKLGPGVRLDDVHGFPYTQTRDGFRVPMHTLTANTRKDLLVSLKVDPTGRHSEVLETRLRYIDAERDRPIERVDSMKVIVSDDSEQIVVPVLKRVQQLRTLAAFKRAMELYDKGDRHAGAAELERQRDENRDFLSRAALDDPAFERVDRKLTDLAEALRKTDVHTTQGKWIKKATYNYANSAVSSEVYF